MDWKITVFFLPLAFLLLVQESDAWRGNVCTRLRTRYERRGYCICRYLWGCSWWRYRWYCVYYLENYCCPGWTHNGNQACTIPICRPTCKNGGTCIDPDVCDCPDAFGGPTCEEPQCSHQFPCYPGYCPGSIPRNCTCAAGFGGTEESGCKDIVADSEKPELGRVTSILAFLKRGTNELKYEFVTDATMSDETVMIWSNQGPFNTLTFEFDSIYMTPDNFPPKRPVYIHDYRIGIVAGNIHTNLSKIPRDGGPIRDVHLDEDYTCSEFSYSNPRLDKKATCNIADDQFSTLIEHGDWLTVTFKAVNGGFRKRLNTDSNQFYTPDDKVLGKFDEKTMEYRFDFEVPIHCSEGNGICQNEPLIIAEEITKNPIKISWGGWDDPLAGMWRYYLEIFKLSPDPYGRLVEMEPLNPIHTQFINLTDPYYVEYTPDTPGMYSILLEALDMANNSKIARRLCLYDKDSTLEIDTSGQHNLFVSTAVSDTGFVWQTSPAVITVVWSGHFFNRVHKDGKLLNQVLGYPVQFAEVEEDGILNSKKWVYTGMDDNEGNRSVVEIPNYNGIIRFEVNEDYQDGTDVPQNNWKTLEDFAENYTFTSTLNSGREMKVWVRAHDAMGHQKHDFTEVKIDKTPPIVGEPSFAKNYQNGTYKYSSRFTFTASDTESGVHTLEYKLIMDSTNEVKYAGNTYANFKTESSLCGTDPECNCIDGVCFKTSQILDIDNCWFLTKTDILKTASVTVLVFVHNQAWLSRNFSRQVSNLNELNGLTETSGPVNVRTSNEQTNGVRLHWNLPDSCYGETDIVILIVETNTKYRVTKESKFIDVLGLEAQKSYTANFRMIYQNEDLGISASHRFSTLSEPEEGPNVGAIVGAVVGVLVIIALVVIIIFLLRRGRAPQPIQRKWNAISVKYRQSKGDMSTSKRNNEYDNRVMSELYIYGGMDFDSKQAWHLERDDITFESVIKQGHFANIYKATMHHGTKAQEQVVAKTLKETHSNEDQQLMLAKINFMGTVVGNHPNVLKFIGAVIDDETLGPFIVHEYCENGTLKEYLDKNKNNVTIELQELLFRFGLDIAKGMEYLANKDIVHRRLAARNILLNFLNEVKITGFGPQPAEAGDADAESGKRERIPVKWMAPECMESTAGATTKSDVWSYGVVLWEIFSLGETPYPNIRSRDLPGRVKKGERLRKPEQCDDTWYTVMKKTWSYEIKKRPTFTDIRDELDQMFVSSGDDFYYYKQ